MKSFAGNHVPHLLRQEDRDNLIIEVFRYQNKK
jgi:hypothetical protein